MLQFRRATAGDAARMRALTRAAYAKWVPLIGREPLPMTADAALAIAAHLVDLCEAEGRLLGLVETIPYPDHLLIENLAVAPEEQGRGLGGRLLRHAEALAGQLGLAEVRLYTNAAFAANLAFYAHRGYREFRREVMVAGSLAVHMRKTLATEAPSGPLA